MISWLIFWGAVWCFPVPVHFKFLLGPGHVSASYISYELSCHMFNMDSRFFIIVGHCTESGGICLYRCLQTRECIPKQPSWRRHMWVSCLLQWLAAPSEWLPVHGSAQPLGSKMVSKMIFLWSLVTKWYQWEHIQIFLPEIHSYFSLRLEFPFIGLS